MEKVKIETTPVAGSGWVAASGYDPGSQTLRVELSSGKTYDYVGVEPEKAEEAAAVAADPDRSFGSWLNSVVKNGGYTTRQVG